MPYGLIDQKIFDSTIMGYGFETAYVFMSMIALADEIHVVDFGKAALARRINIDIEMLEKALNSLTEPDPDSKNQDFQGRRIIPLKEIEEIESNRGWYIVNREQYIKQVKREARKAANLKAQQKIREKRAKDVSNNTNDVSNKSSTRSKYHQSVITSSAHVDVDVDVDIEKKINKRKPTIEEIRKYCQERNNNIDPEHFFNYYESINWMRGKNKIKNWKSCVLTWERNNYAKGNNTDTRAKRKGTLERSQDAISQWLEKQPEPRRSN